MEAIQPKKKKRRKETALEREVRLAILAIHDLAFPAEQLRAFQKISPALNKSLKQRKLWHSEIDPNCTPFENGLPGYEKRAAFHEEDLEAGTLDALAGEDPASRGTELEAVDESFAKDEFAEDEGEAVGEDFDRGGFSIHPFFPLLSRPPLYRLLRRAPFDLKGSIARDLFDTHYFLTLERWNLLPALCFYEVSIEAEQDFLYVRGHTYLDGRFHVAGKEFLFKEYKDDLLRVYRVIAKRKRSYFAANLPLRREVAKVRKDPDTFLETIWPRFEKAWKNLSRKQKNALERVYIDRTPQVRVAKKLRITLDSLRDRLEGASLRLRRALPELATLSPSITYRESRKRNYLHSGLFDKRAAATPSDLLLVDLKTGKRAKADPQKPRFRSGVDHERVRVWIMDTTPVPDFAFTDYFTGLISRGARDRMSTFNTVHDRGASRSNFANKLSKHQKARPR